MMIITVFSLARENYMYMLAAAVYLGRYRYVSQLHDGAR
jgi:hypothetical protein